MSDRFDFYMAKMLDCLPYLHTSRLSQKSRRGAPLQASREVGSLSTSLELPSLA